MLYTTKPENPPRLKSRFVCGSLVGLGCSRCLLVSAVKRRFVVRLSVIQESAVGFACRYITYFYFLLALIWPSTADALRARPA